jgi:hypothetical protein
MTGGVRLEIRATKAAHAGDATSATARTRPQADEERGGPRLPLDARKRSSAEGEGCARSGRSSKAWQGKSTKKFARRLAASLARKSVGKPHAANLLSKPEGGAEIAVGCRYVSSQRAVHRKTLSDTLSSTSMPVQFPRY